MQTSHDNTAPTLGIHHLGLTVIDVDQTARFFTEVLGYTVVGGKPDYPAIFVSDGTTMLTLWQAAESCAPFDRKTALGLHHFALRVGSRDTLDALHTALRDRDNVEIEFGPEPVGSSSWRHMICRIPGGPRMELVFVPQ